jgi:protein tyrosine/serine phosphatase
MAAKKRSIPPQQVDMSNMEAFLIQHGSYIDASREEMIRENGSIQNYIREGLGLSGQEINNLRNELLE